MVKQHLKGERWFENYTLANFLVKVKVMIISRYRCRPVTVFEPTLPNVTQRDINGTDRYWPLPIVTEVYRYLGHNL